MKQKNKVPQEPQPVQILIEFPASGTSEPNIKFGKGITPGQVQNAAFMLRVIAESEIHNMLQQKRIEEAQKEAQSRIVVPGAAMGGVAGMGGMPA